MKPLTTDSAQGNYPIDRGVQSVLPGGTLSSILKERPSRLRIKMGFDPTKPDLHLGHTVGLRKLRQLQYMGHLPVIIIGDYTARIGDPSGRDTTRPELTTDEIETNLQTYLHQVGKILDTSDGVIEIRRQTEWYESMSLADLLQLAKTASVNQMLHRDDFRKRIDNGNSITMTEFLYPILQGYDSVAVKADIEFGGSDQTFNLLMGREMQKTHGMPQQTCVTFPLLVGTDGVQKMGKSTGNYIALTDTPNDMYTKTMQLPDDQLVSWITLLTDKLLLENVENPYETKKALAKQLVTDYHGFVEATLAEQYWNNQVSQKNAIKPTHFVDLLVLKDVGMLDALIACGAIANKAEYKRLSKDRAIALLIDDHVIRLPLAGTTSVAKPRVGDMIKVGKKRYVEIT